MSLLWEWEQKRIKKHAKKIWRFHFPSIHMNLKPLPGHSLRDRWWKYWDITQPVALKPLRARDSGVILDQCSMSRRSAHRSVTETYWLAFQTSKANLMDGSKILLSRFSCFRVYSCLADLSKNRLTEIPPEVCLFAPLESLNLYHNCIKCIPEAIINLQMLTYLDIRWVIAKTILSVWGMYQCVLFYISQEVLVPHLRTQTGHEMLTWKRGISSFAETQFPAPRYSLLHPIVCCLQCRSLFYLYPQPKSSVSSAKIPVQPPPQSSAREQQQARVHPGGDRPVQRVDGTGERRVRVSVHMNSSRSCRQCYSISYTLSPLAGRELQWDPGAASSGGEAPRLTGTQHQEELSSHAAWGSVHHYSPRRYLTLTFLAGTPVLSRPRITPQLCFFMSAVM